MFGLWLDYLLLSLVSAVLAGAIARLIGWYYGVRNAGLLSWTISGTYVGVVLCNAFLCAQSGPLAEFVQKQFVVDWSVAPVGFIGGAIIAIVFIFLPFLGLNVRKLPPYFFVLTSVISLILAKLIYHFLIVN